MNKKTPTKALATIYIRKLLRLKVEKDFNLYGGIFLPPICKMNYVNISLIYVSMQRNYAEMQHNYLDIQESYFDMRLKLCCMLT